MRALFAPIALTTLLAGTAYAQAPKFIKVDIVGKSVLHELHQKDNADGPTEVHIRMPISMAKGLLDMAGDGEVKVNHKTMKNVKVDQLVKLLETAKPGDILLEITTDKGDLVQVTVQ